MKVYFCGSIRGGRDDVIVYQRIVRKLQSYGRVLTEHVSSEELSSKGQRSHTHTQCVLRASTALYLVCLMLIT